MKIRHMIAAAALIFPALAAAQTSPAPVSPTDERRLSPEQIDAILADAAAKRAGSSNRVADLDEPDPTSPPPRVHGEIGVGIGTGGYREAFGTAFYPIGEDGMAAISFDFVDWNRRRYRR